MQFQTQTQSTNDRKFNACRIHQIRFWTPNPNQCSSPAKMRTVFSPIVKMKICFAVCLLAGETDLGYLSIENRTIFFSPSGEPGFWCTDECSRGWWSRSSHPAWSRKFIDVINARFFQRWLTSQITPHGQNPNPQVVAPQPHTYHYQPQPYPPLPNPYPYPHTPTKSFLERYLDAWLQVELIKRSELLAWIQSWRQISRHNPLFLLQFCRPRPWQRRPPWHQLQLWVIVARVWKNGQFNFGPSDPLAPTIS